MRFIDVLKSLAQRLLGKGPFGDPGKGKPSGSPMSVGYANGPYSEWNPFERYSNPISLFYDFYEQNPWVKGVCNKISHEVMNDGWQLEDQTEVNKKHPEEDHLKEWLKKVSFSTRVLYPAALDLAICHNAFFYIQRNGLGQIMNLIRIPPQTMRPKGNATEGVTKWEQQVGAKKMDFKPEEIWHIKGPNPLSDIVGLPLMTAVIIDVEADNAMSQFNRTFFGNGTSAGTVFTWKQEELRNPKTGEWTSKDEDRATQLWTQMTNYIEKRYGNPTSAHLPLVLRGDWDVKGTGQAKADAQFLEGRMFNARMVCTVYGFPMEALGLGEKGKLGGTLVDGSQEQLDSVVRHFANLVFTSFQERILHYELDIHDLVIKPNTRPNRITVDATLAVKNLSTTGCYTKNEIRALTNHPRLNEGGDELIAATPHGTAAGEYDTTTAQQLTSSIVSGIEDALDRLFTRRG